MAGARSLLRAGGGLWAVLAILCLTGPPAAAEDFERRRERMLKRDIEGRGVTDEDVLRAMREVPRHRFVPPKLQDEAYDDHPLPIGHGQTISQPYIVAVMTEMLKLGTNSVVLEVGTGSGYQAAILSRIVKEVYTVEIIPELAASAQAVLAELKYRNVEAKQGDGYYGWEEHSPYHGIIVTAAASHIPPPLIAQLKPGGRMIIPVGPPSMVQHLMLVEKNEEGEVFQRNVMAVRFVPLTGSH
jgi:protein-L-isoaspartate(D-aspartate) O-methyltransferase